MNSPLQIIQLLKISFIDHDRAYADEDVETNRQQREHQDLVP
jgi:hypothetical protein